MDRTRARRILPLAECLVNDKLHYRSLQIEAGGAFDGRRRAIDTPRPEGSHTRRLNDLRAGQPRHDPCRGPVLREEMTVGPDQFGAVYIRCSR